MHRYVRPFQAFLVVALITLVQGFVPAALAATRTALVIGNSAYPFGPLLNPANDAKLMAETLKKTGFDVTTVLDADKQTMQKALVEFSREIRTKDTVGLFYFAGHGAQVNGANYLIPVDADIKSESEVKIFAINVDDFVATLERADGRTNIVILDSCRNNPFGVGTRSVNRGMALPDAPAGTFVALSTSPGAVALDGEGNNSPYAEALAKSLLQPDLSIEQTFKVTRRLVLESTKQKQVPWETSSLTGDFYFMPKTSGQPKTTEPEAPAEAPVAEAAPEPPVEVQKAEEPKTEDETQVAVVDQPPVDESQRGPEVATEPPAEVAAPEATTDVEYRTLDMEPKAYPVGKWPEGIVWSGGFIWVAESGARSLAKLDPINGSVLQRFNVGRLPVNLAASPEGDVYANVITEGKIYKQPASAKGKAIASFKRPTYVQGLSFGAGAAYTASYSEVENRQTVISRIDPKTGKRTDSAPAGAEPRAFVMAQDAPWLLDASGIVTLYDTETLQPKDAIANDGFLWSMAANLDAVFVGGRAQQQDGKSIVYRYAQGNPQDRVMQELDSEELIIAMAANNDRVAALGDGGTYWILDAISLKPLKVIKTGRRPQTAVFEGGSLYVTTHSWEGENGAVLMYEGVGNID